MIEEWKWIGWCIVIIIFGAAIYISNKTISVPTIIVQNRADETEALSTLTRLKNTLDQFVDQLYNIAPDDVRVQRMKSRYTFTKMMETIEETYTINKGEKIGMCLRNHFENGQLHDDFNLLMFVALHELGHIMSNCIDHPPEFWKNYQFILDHAAKMNYYIGIDYTYHPTPYCKMVIVDNPHFHSRTQQELAQQIIDTIKGRNPE